MGSEANSRSSTSAAITTAVSTSISALTSASPSPTAKRCRDPEDEVYIDNLHSHKRYLSEIMASSLNGLTVGDTLTDNIMDSPARSEGASYHRDEMPLQYSPMSEDSDECRYYDTCINTCSSQAESEPCSPVSPYRYQKPLSGFFSGPPTTSYPAQGATISYAASSPQNRQRGSSDCEGRFPSSPSDICNSGDLRKAALLRSVQMRTQPLGSSNFEWQYTSSHESGQTMDTEDRSSSCVKSLVDEREYQIRESSSSSISTPKAKNQEEYCRASSNVNSKGEVSPE